MADLTPPPPRNVTRVHVKPEHFADDQDVWSAFCTALCEATGDPNMDIGCNLSNPDEQDSRVVVWQPHTAWHAWLPDQIEGLIAEDWFGDARKAALKAARDDLLQFDLDWREGEPPEDADDD